MRLKLLFESDEFCYKIFDGKGMEEWPDRLEIVPGYCYMGFNEGEDMAGLFELAKFAQIFGNSNKVGVSFAVYRTPIPRGMLPVPPVEPYEKPRDEVGYYDHSTGFKPGWLKPDVVKAGCTVAVITVPCTMSRYRLYDENLGRI